MYRAIKLCLLAMIVSMGLLHYTLYCHQPHSRLQMYDDNKSSVRPLFVSHVPEKQWDLEARGPEAGQRRVPDGGSTAARWVALSVRNGEKDGLLLEKSVNMLKSESRLVSTGARAQSVNMKSNFLSSFDKYPKPLPRFHMPTEVLKTSTPTNSSSNYISYKSSNFNKTSPNFITRRKSSKSLPVFSKDTLPHSSKWTPPQEDPTTDPTLSPRLPGGGYVVVNKVYEQQTMASGNLLQLQCWASMLNMSLVKPYMRNSYIRTPLDVVKHSFMLKFGDTFNESHWQEHIKKHGYLPLVEWEKWVESGPRNVIAVQLMYPLLSTVKEIRRQGIEFPHPHTGDTFKTGCQFKYVSGNNQKALKAKGFNIVRRVCFNFLSGDEFMLNEFNEHIFGDFEPNEVSVVFDEWRGLAEPQRVLIHEKICHEEHPFREQIRPSARVTGDAEKYIQKYLDGGNYIAVLARFEMTGLTRQHSKDNDAHAEILRCISLTLSQLKRLQLKSAINTTFLAIDIGKYGSISFLKKKYYNHFSEMSNFVESVYGGRMSLKGLEESLENESGVKDAGYIALLQQLIATRAKCVLFVGGGSFQRHALHIYQELNPPTQQCFEVVEPCTSQYRPVE